MASGHEHGCEFWAPLTYVPAQNDQVAVDASGDLELSRLLGFFAA